MEPRLRLHYAPDNASVIIRMVLEELGTPFLTALVHRAVRAHESPEYLALNPAGKIPALETGNSVMFETAAILLWLADSHTRLAPTVESAERGAFLSWLFYMSNTQHAYLRTNFYPEQFADGAAAQDAVRARARTNIAHGFDLFEQLAREGRPWFAAPAPSVLDFYVACALRWVALYPKDQTGWFDLGRWPFLTEMVRALETRPSVISATRAEGLGPTPFSNPTFPTPPEGSPV